MGVGGESCLAGASLPLQLLYDTFSAFGVVVNTKVMRDPDTGMSKGFGFISFDSFDASGALEGPVGRGGG